MITEEQRKELRDKFRNANEEHTKKLTTPKEMCIGCKFWLDQEGIEGKFSHCIKGSYEASDYLLGYVSECVDKQYINNF